MTFKLDMDRFDGWSKRRRCAVAVNAARLLWTALVVVLIILFIIRALAPSPALTWLKQISQPGNLALSRTRLSAFRTFP